MTQFMGIIKLRLITLIIISILLFKTTFSIRCDRTPEGFSANKSPADGRFALKITGNPDKYSPGETYSVVLHSTRQNQIPQKFIGFGIAAEKDLTDLRDQFVLSHKMPNPDVGEFQLVSDAFAIFSSKCSGLVQHSSSVPKAEVQVLWTAPQSGAGCIAIRATVIEHRDVWYKDDGRLTKVLCEDEVDSLDSQPAIVNPCCACDEAKYELTFEGLWSRHTHPKDFPSNGWLTRFSDVIGASHTVDYRFWDYGRISSEGLQQIAEHGSTRKLEHELKEESEHIRTIIKARGISYPNVTGKTFAVFRVDSNNHLISLVSQVDPSPDWFVGVSGLELCLPNCSWTENKVLNLYPWDAGTDSGATYISPDQPTYPRESIRRIKTNYPNDPRSPFYDVSGAEMKPMARLFLNRQRVYEKNCEGGSAEENVDNACETGSWSSWSECNVQCGQGKRFRQRSYLNPIAAQRSNCKKKLTMREVCHGTNCDQDEFHPDDKSNEDSEPVDPDCEMTPWGPWSDCSNKCGMGTRTRSRRFKNKRMSKKCSQGQPDPPKVQQTEECRSEEECVGDITPEPLSHRNNHNNNVYGSNLSRNVTKCKMTGWSEWTPCTATTCGLGWRLRSRFPVHKYKEYKSFQQSLVDRFRRKSSLRKGREGQTNQNDDNSEEDDEDDHNAEYFTNKIEDSEDPCFGEVTVEEVKCGHELPSCDQGLYGTPAFCFLDPIVGPCRVTANRWYFDKNKSDCSIFPYTECGGNKNNFLSREDCMDTCGRSSNMDSLIRDHVVLHTEPQTKEKIHCKVSEWRKSACNVTCGEGYRVKFRDIIEHPKNGGRKCPNKLQKAERCYINCQHDQNVFKPLTDESVGEYDCHYSEWSAWSPCSKTCGQSAIQQRTRQLINSDGILRCNQRLEERLCEHILPCMIG